jgi:hypothetical protein
MRTLNLGCDSKPITPRYMGLKITCLNLLNLGLTGRRELTNQRKHYKEKYPKHEGIPISSLV